MTLARAVHDVARALAAISAPIAQTEADAIRQKLLIAKASIGDALRAIDDARKAINPNSTLANELHFAERDLQMAMRSNDRCRAAIATLPGGAARCGISSA